MLKENGKQILAGTQPNKKSYTFGPDAFIAQDYQEIMLQLLNGLES